MGTTGNSTGVHLHFGLRPKECDKNDGWLGYIDPLPLLSFETVDVSAPVPGTGADESESVAGWAEIICEDGANVRLSPGGEYKTWLPKGIRVQKIGQTSIANGLVWEEITGGLYIARADSTGTVMLEDIE